MPVFGLPGRWISRDSLERIAFDWNRMAVPIKRADPLDLDSVDQIHAVGGSPQAIPTDRDLVYMAHPMSTMEARTTFAPNFLS